MFIDTFMARTLNIMFATKPLYVFDGMPKELRDPCESFFNRKAIADWRHYELCRDMLVRGPKNGTAIMKTTWVSDIEMDVMPGQVGEEQEVPYERFVGPKTRLVHFEDFYVYPITAPTLDDTLIKFERVRWQEEEARDRFERWQHLTSDQLEGLSWEMVKSWLQHPSDSKRAGVQSDAGVIDAEATELHTVECHLRYALKNTGQRNSIVAVLCPSQEKLLDVYFHPYPKNCDMYTEYKPFPQEDLFYGESLCEILAQAQEEASCIHNDRRNNSVLANSVCFKRKNGANIPNPSTNYYPGKVFDVDSMDDLDVMSLGRPLDPMIQEEDYVFRQAELLSGIGSAMMGSSIGSQKKGVYNTQGTLGVMAEGNQRQDTNIRDARSVFGNMMRGAVILQSYYRPDDPAAELLPEKLRPALAEAMKYINSNRMAGVKVMVKTSNAGANSEVRKAGLLQMSQVVGQYAVNAMQAAQALIGQPNMAPALKQVMEETISMQRWLAVRLLMAWEEEEAEEVLPDVAGTIQAAAQAASQGAAGGQMAAGATPSPSALASQPGLRTLLAGLGGAAGVAGQNGVGGPDMGGLPLT
jgi:hypothetical protein